MCIYVDTLFFIFMTTKAPASGMDYQDISGVCDKIDGKVAAATFSHS